MNKLVRLQRNNDKLRKKIRWHNQERIKYLNLCYGLGHRPDGWKVAKYQALCVVLGFVLGVMFGMDLI